MVRKDSRTDGLKADGAERLTTKQHWDVEWGKKFQPRAFNPKKCSNFAFDLIFEEFLPRGTLKALEIGVGGSIWPAYFATFLGYEVFGLDYSEIGCLSAHTNYLAATGKSLRAVLGDVFQCPIKERSFDIVYSLGVVEHFSDPTKILRIARNLLKPDGILLTIIPNKAGIAGRTERWLNPDNYNRHNPLTREDLESLYQFIGLTKVQTRYFGFISVIGKFPDQLGSILRIVSKLNKAFTYYLVYPIYMKANLRPSHRAISSFIVAYGHRSAST